MDQNKLNSESSTATAIVISSLNEQSNKRFAVVGLLGMAIDLFVFRMLVAMTVNPDLSQVASFFSGAIVNFALNARAMAAQSAESGSRLTPMPYGRFLIVSLLVLFLRSAVLSLLIRTWHWQLQIAILAAILTGAAGLFIGTVLFVVPTCWLRDWSAGEWQVVTIAILAYVLALRAVFMPLVDLIPEEAYYWNYAQHLDLSYLDHPPMVGWLIWLSTSLLGKSEFAVRLPAYICWIVAALFMFRLTLNLFDRTTAFRVVLLVAVLPIYFGLGFFMTPDAPLYAAWAGCLYFLQRALLAQDHKAWCGVGICMGVGMLSKYTVVLLGLGTLTFLLLDPRSRRWFLRREPYLAAVIALVLFTPVLLWNMRHDWISFMFQGPDRLTSSPKFSLHVLIGSVFLLLTPTAVFGIAKVLLPQSVAKSSGSDQISAERRRYLWALSFTSVLLSVFVIYSLRHQVKLNWTASVWLAAIPLAAWDMVPRPHEIAGSVTKLIRRLWLPTIIGLLIIHGAGFYYLSLGLPGAGPLSSKHLFAPWRLLGEKVAILEATIEAETKSEPVIVGMDKNFISSELSFYAFADHDGMSNTGGPHFFGERSLMWEVWLPGSAVLGRNFLMIDFDRRRLSDLSLSQHFDTTSDVSREVLERNGRAIGSFYWRVGYRYHGLTGKQKTGGGRDAEIESR
jgi:dolichol-phosphate mannosyltransferase